METYIRQSYNCYMITVLMLSLGIIIIHIYNIVMLADYGTLIYNPQQQL